MKPLLSANESSVDELQQSISFCDVFDASSASPIPADPVRASTPVSSMGEISGITHDDPSSSSILAPQNISLITQDLTTSFSSQTPSPIKESDCPPPLCDGYVHGLMCFGFKLVGDNLDKTIKPRDMRVDNLPQSLHYFNVYAVLDRVDFRALSGDTTIIDVAKVDTDLFLPSARDIEAIIANFRVLISRVLTEHLPALCQYSTCVASHIDHKYSREMSAKSHVVRT